MTLDKNCIGTRSLKPTDGYCLVVAKRLLARLASASFVTSLYVEFNEYSVFCSEYSLFIAEIHAHLAN